jgi:hypothetical protein
MFLSVTPAWGAVATTKCPRVELGRCKHGLHCGFTSDGSQV